MQWQAKTAYARGLFAEDAPERDCLLLCEGMSWWDPSSWWEIVGVRQADGALRVRHVERGTLSWCDSRYTTPLTLGACDFCTAVEEMWERTNA